MSMQAASLEVLEKANLPAPQARAIVQAIEIEIAGARDTLATKQDTLLLRQDMAELGHDLRQEMSDLRQGMSKLGQDLRQEMSDLRHGLELKIEGMRSEIHASASSARCTGRSSDRWRCCWGLPTFSWHTSGVD